ncbi:MULTISPECIES: formate/nitrite transporter family protein [Sanguibacter]|jgi:formate/nitrite transporter FocA (FNT family)|uniref:Formate/nitrite transporter family protein n=2 Tax=Sanguibacter TaxID=60919 RepID=A0A853EY41_9MICO|nr:MULTISPECIES: formate/nitrite transporter family protein [Sanguibacter]MBF0724216.1 formate/nitrite transporter family protein [Sanguibacter inulinus]NYS95361.1 formate/nitrite transporter family protein [Sanguibacter inulinus]WPF82057.1 formate/nitrite transporter family protein [Sanguibacter sp. 4.1]
MLDNASLFPGKHFISTVLEALETKTAMSSALVRQYLMRAAMAGVIIGLMYGVNFAVIAAFEEAGDGLYLVGKIVGALFFGWALVFIYYSKSELLTSNMMIVSIGLYHRRTTVGKALRILGLCYVGNIVGGLLVAVLFRFSSLTSGATGELMTDAVDHKLGYLTEGVTGWTDLLIRAVLCNFMINIAMLLVYNGIIKDDLTRCLVMVISVFVFAFLGLEHSVANTVLFFVVGLQDGIDVGLAAGNLGIALLGNLLGGGLLIGLYYAYVNDDSRFVARTTPGA